MRALKGAGPGVRANKKTMIRYLIFGSGSVGTLLGGLLAGSDHHVVFVGRKWNIEGIRDKGINISGVWGEHQT